MIPMRRSTLLWGKFFFSAAGSLAISAALIALSDVMLGLSGWVIATHMLVVLCVCCGLNGMAVGLGAVYPDVRTDNPSQIVSSFGGTLNLVCSIVFILTSVILMALPLQMQATGAATGKDFVALVALCLSLDVALALIACLVPMLAGIRAFRRMEF
jgi:ABC-2 type transport system permease protein